MYLYLYNPSQGYLNLVCLNKQWSRRWTCKIQCMYISLISQWFVETFKFVNVFIILLEGFHSEYSFYFMFIYIYLYVPSHNLKHFCEALLPRARFTWDKIRPETLGKLYLQLWAVRDWDYTLSGDAASTANHAEIYSPTIPYRRRLLP